MNILKYLLVVVCSYLLGSISMSILLSRGMSRGDVRSHGSGNAGATNMARVYGMGAGLLTLAGDMVKTLLATGLGWWLLQDNGLAVAGMACMLGHCFPIFHGFKGGKGISVGAAIGLAIDWRVFVFIIAVFLIAALLTKKVSVGSVCASVAIVVASLIFHVSVPRLILAIFGMCLAIIRHRANLKRLAEGTEPDFKAADSKK